MTRDKERERAAASEDYIVDERGRALRVAFPLYERFWLEASSGRSASRGMERLGARVGWEKSWAFDFHDEEIWWVLRHTFLHTEAWSPERGTWRLEGALLSGQYLRHDLSSFVLIPSLNDLRLPANFDIALNYNLLDVELERAAERGAWRLERARVAEAAVMMDLIRDETYRHRLAFGPAAEYTFERQPGERSLAHRLSPMTGIKALYGWDHPRGLFRLYSEARCAASVLISLAEEARATPSPWAWRCGAEALTEWTFMAINDRAISLPVKLNIERDLAPGGRSELALTLGLRLSASP